MRLNQITLPASDLPGSIAFYRMLGFDLIVKNDSYARLENPSDLSTLSLELRDGGDGARVYFECDDLDSQVLTLKEKGIQFDIDPNDQPWLWREAWLRDPAGNKLCFVFRRREPALPALAYSRIGRLACL